MTSDEIPKDPDGPDTASVDAVPSGDGPDTADVDAEDPGWPWSFILLVVAGALYLIFRFGEAAIRLLN